MEINIEKKKEKRVEIKRIHQDKSSGHYGELRRNRDNRENI